jgi:hypothetical protein
MFTRNQLINRDKFDRRHRMEKLEEEEELSIRLERACGGTKSASAQNNTSQSEPHKRIKIEIQSIDSLSLSKNRFYISPN